MSDTVEQFLRTSLAQMNYPTHALDQDTPLGADGLDVDSLAREEIALRITDDYGVKLSEEEITKMAELSFGQLVALLRSRIAGAA
jgi:acyl carrier protein